MYRLYPRPIVMVNFMCHINWAMESPDSTLFLVVSMRVFLDEISIWIGGLSKVDCLPQCGWATSNPLRAWIEQNADEGSIPSLPVCYLELGPQSFPALGWRFISLAFLVSRSSHYTHTHYWFCFSGEHWPIHKLNRIFRMAGVRPKNQ